MGKRNLPEEKDLRKKFRDLRDGLRKQVEEYEDLGFKADDAETTITYHYGILARLEDELDKVPRDEELLKQLETILPEERDNGVSYVNIPERTYNALLNRIKRLDAKLGRVSILTTLAKTARLLTQGIQAKAQIEESKANTKRIEITTHFASLQALSRMFYLSLRKLGYTDAEIVRVAKELKRLEKDFPLVETDYESMRKQLYAKPEDMPKIIDADFEEVDELKGLNDVVLGTKAKRGNK